MYPELFLHRCKKKVPASKRFTIHRASNVLTLSLKRFANFSGGKITKVRARRAPSPRPCWPERRQGSCEGSHEGSREGSRAQRELSRSPAAFPQRYWVPSLERWACRAAGAAFALARRIAETPSPRRTWGTPSS